MSRGEDLADLGVLEAAELLRARRISALELLEACERRIDERNGGEPTFDGAPDAVNAFVRRYPELAARHAQEADRRLAREGDQAPLLCGIPVALKDLFGVAGLPLTASSRVLDGHVAAEDSAAWRRLREAGMVLVGHTHTHEFGAGGTCDQVANPWAPDRSPGGSSGGSAAALATGMVPAALGTDTCGSLRIPAAMCGVSSIKPTHGRVPIAGVLPLSPSYDHAGPMARSVADAAALLDVLASGGAERTPLMPPPAPLPALPLRTSAADRPLAGVTVAVTDRAEALGCEPDVLDGLATARAACEALGATIVELPAAPDLDPADLSAILFPETWAFHEPFADRADRYRTSIREFVELGRDSGSAVDYVRAHQRRTAVTDGWETWFERHGVDVLLDPAAVTTAPVRGPGYDSGNLGGEGDPLIALTVTWNTTGFPVVALPAGMGARSGLPVGVQLVAPRGREDVVVRVGIDLQAGPLPPLGQAPDPALAAS
jgi:aspartyl-tRNA(Asn)/glutamyl-tRNA(Gln) amidotransferase subunit A